MNLEQGITIVEGSDNTVFNRHSLFDNRYSKTTSVKLRLGAGNAGFGHLADVEVAVEFGVGVAGGLQHAWPEGGHALGRRGGAGGLSRGDLGRAQRRRHSPGQRRLLRADARRAVYADPKDDHGAIADFLSAYHCYNPHHRPLPPPSHTIVIGSHLRAIIEILMGVLPT